MPPTPDEIRSAMESYIKYMCESDIDGIMDLYADDAFAEDPDRLARSERSDSP